MRMAAGHYQFEAIHPFTDGNGRTGRVINLLYLVEQGLLDIPVLYSRELAELVFVRPYCRIAHVVEAGLAKRQTASTYLQALVAIGILREHKMGREKDLPQSGIHRSVEARLSLLGQHPA